MNIINSAAVMPPQGAYSNAVVAGNLVFIGGQVGVDKDLKPVGDFGMASQTRQTIANIRLLLAEAGCTLDDVVSTTVYVKNFSEYKTMDAAYQECFGNHKPARATVQAELVMPSLLVEIQAIAVRPQSAVA